MSRKGIVLGGEDLLFCPFGIDIQIRIIKKSELVFGFKHPAAGMVDVVFTNQAFIKRLLQCGQESLSYHIEIHAGFECHGRNLLKIAHAMFYHFVDGCVISNHKAIEAPFIPQHLCKQPAVS